VNRGDRKAIAAFMQAVDRAIMSDLPAGIVSGYVAGACQAVAIVANVSGPLAEEMNLQAHDIDEYVLRLLNSTPDHPPISAEHGAKVTALHDLTRELRNG
jgi:hypothetical protein